MAAVLMGIVTLLLAMAAWGGLAWLVLTVPPDGQMALAAFYVFAFAGISSTAALLAWLVRRGHYQTGRFRSPVGYLGHAMLLASISLFALWLQSLRMLTVTGALLLAGLYVFLELALLFGTRGSVDIEVPTRTYKPTDS